MPGREKTVGFVLNLFTPETWQAFRAHGATVAGFRDRMARLARERVHPGDIFLCYLVRLSRWCGALEVVSEAFDDATPIYADPDPFTVRFRVKPVVLLDPEQAIPIHAPGIWSALSMTRDQQAGSSPGWSGHFRSSLKRMRPEDGQLVLSALKVQTEAPRPWPLTDRDRRQLARRPTVRTLSGEIAVEIPDDADEEAETPQLARESIRMQATVARTGAVMGFRIWVPRNDRARVLEQVGKDLHPAFLDALPLNYDDATLQTIENIDVIWLKGRAMSRAFEIEHTTATHSGLLRMADLLALQPNMDIRLHIVAPDDRRDKVLTEIRRPVFTALDRGPLRESCSFIGDGAIMEIAALPHLAHVSDQVLKDDEDRADDA